MDLSINGIYTTLLEQWFGDPNEMHCRHIASDR